MAEEKTALITGGGTGLGRAIAAQLVADGFVVTIVGRRADVLDQAVTEIDPQRVRRVVADCSSPDDVRRLADEVSAPLDVLVLNAGGNTPASGDDLESVVRKWTADFTLNVLTAVLPAEVLLPVMRRPGGRVIAMSSVAALRGSGSYGAAKGAMNTWITGLAAEVAGDGITVNAVAPGFIPDTEFWDDRRTPEVFADRISGIPLGRAGSPDDVAGVVRYLASDAGGFTTGQVVGVHGGAVLARL